MELQVGGHAANPLKVRQVGRRWQMNASRPYRRHYQPPRTGPASWIKTTFRPRRWRMAILAVLEGGLLACRTAASSASLPATTLQVPSPTQPARDGQGGSGRISKLPPAAQDMMTSSSVMTSALTPDLRPKPSQQAPVPWPVKTRPKKTQNNP